MTTAHMLKLVKLGGFNGNHVFRVDKGFVAQTADVLGGRPAPLDRRQQVVLFCLFLSRYNPCQCWSRRVMPGCTCRKRLRRQCPLRCRSMSSTINGASCRWAGWMIQTVADHHFPFCLARLRTLTCTTPYGGMANQVNQHQTACLQNKD